MTSLAHFVQAHINNLCGGMGNPYFKDLMSALDISYRAAIKAMPHTGVPTIFGRFLLICDKAMRSAAMLIAARQPEDSVPITRRAIEAAKTALAIKLNEENATKWLAVDKRMERWAERRANKKPKGILNLNLVDIAGEPLIDQLGDFLGMISDAYVHFTPEFYDSLDWEVRADAEGPGGKIFLNYFQTNEREIERHYTLLAAVHGVILKAFDKCADGQIWANAECRERLNNFQKIGHDLNVEYQRKYLEPAIEEGKPGIDQENSGSV